jgi:hypothetical protein
MSDVSDLLDFMRMQFARFDEKLGEIRADVQNVKGRLALIEGEIGNTRVVLTDMNRRVGLIEMQVESIDNRFESAYMNVGEEPESPAPPPPQPRRRISRQPRSEFAQKFENLISHFDAILHLHGISRTAVCRAGDVSPSQYSLWINGKAVPMSSSWEKMVAGLKETWPQAAEDFLRETGTPEPEKTDI